MAMGDLARRLLVLVAVAFAAWLCLLVTFRRLPGLLAALLSWGVASVSAAWVVAVLQQHRLWPLV